MRQVFPLFVAILACSGCVDIRETISLRSDGSRSARIGVSFSQLGLRSLPGNPTAGWVRPNFSDGVRLLSFKNEGKGEVHRC